MSILKGSLSVVIPAFNEGLRLPATLDLVVDYLNRRGYPSVEVLVVDDGSSDRTAQIARDYGAPVRLVANPGNRGKGYSVRHGMFEAQGDWALFTDADLSAPIEELQKLEEAVVREEADIAIGSRAVDRSLIGVHQSAFRENAGRIFNLIMRMSTGLPFLDTQCGFKLFSRAAAGAIFQRQQLDRFGFDVEVLFLADRLGYRTVEVPVRWNHADGSKVGLLSGLDGFVDLARIRWNQVTGKYR